MKTGDVDLATVFGPRDAPTTTSRVILGYQGDGKAVGEIRSNGFPLGQTQFTDAVRDRRQQADRSTQDAVEPGTATWVNGSHRQAYSYQAGVNTGRRGLEPDRRRTRSSCRPSRSTADRDRRADHGAPVRRRRRAPDTELFVQLLDRAPDGTLLYLNRGMLRASHRAIDEAESQKTADGQIYRPYRPHESARTSRRRGRRTT